MSKKILTFLKFKYEKRTNYEMQWMETYFLHAIWFRRVCFCFTVFARNYLIPPNVLHFFLDDISL
jgi:hypothetical protein